MFYLLLINRYGPLVKSMQHYYHITLQSCANIITTNATEKTLDAYCMLLKSTLDVEKLYLVHDVLMFEHH